MPEKRYKRGCGPGCLGCWVNNLKHGNPTAKDYLKRHPELEQEAWAIHHVRPPKRSKVEETCHRAKVRELENLQDRRVKAARQGEMNSVTELRIKEKELDRQLDTEEYTLRF